MTIVHYMAVFVCSMFDSLNNRQLVGQASHPQMGASNYSNSHSRLF